MRKRRWKTNVCTLSFVCLVRYPCVIERMSESHCGWMTVAYSAWCTPSCTLIAVAVIVNLLVLTVKYAILGNKLFITNTECVHCEVRAAAGERVEQQAYNET
jgi:uncharacterized membrane protein (DUF485 family)